MINKTNTLTAKSMIELHDGLVFGRVKLAEYKAQLETFEKWAFAPEVQKWNDYIDMEGTCSRISEL